MKVDKIGIMAAMPEEVALLLRDMRDPHEKTVGTGNGARTYCNGILYGKSVTLACSRWGKVAAASTVTTLIDTTQADLILFTGVAGGLSTAFEIGDVIVGNELMQHDLDTRPLYKRYEVPQLGVERFPVLPEYVDLAVVSAERYLQVHLPSDVRVGTVPADALAEFEITQPKVGTGLIVTGDQFIADVALRDQLRVNVPDALCVEMEGGAVAQVCYERGIPLVVVRTVSDKANHHIDFIKFVETVASHFTCGIVREFIAQI